MSDNRNLYEQVIIDHNKSPRNFRAIDAPTGSAEGYNPLCGDRVVVYVRMEGDVIADVSFTGNGCAISKASASLMTAVLKGKTRHEAEAYRLRFHRMLTAGADAPDASTDMGKLEALRGVRDYPIRIKCATLAWSAMMAALEGQQEPVRTE